MEKRFVADSFNGPMLALSEFRAGLSDFTLLDIRMHGINGFELFREIQNINGNLRVCFIATFLPHLNH